MSIFGIIVEAAKVDAAYVDGAYPYTDFVSIDRAEVERLDEWPFVKGMLGLRRGGTRSTPNDELLLELLSKWPDLFSLRVAESAKPESLREIGVVGGKLPDIGDTEAGGLDLLPDLLVEGRSTRV